MKFYSKIAKALFLASLITITHIAPKASTIIDNELNETSGTSMHKMRTAIENGYATIINKVNGLGLAGFTINGKNIGVVDAIQVRKLFALGEETSDVKTQIGALAALTDDEIDQLHLDLDSEFENGGRFDGIPLNLSFSAIPHPALFGPSSFPSTSCDIEDVCEADQALQILAENYGMYKTYLTGLQPLVDVISEDPENFTHPAVFKKIALGDLVGLSKVFDSNEKEIKSLRAKLKKHGLAAPVIKTVIVNSKQKTPVVIKGKKALSKKAAAKTFTKGLSNNKKLSVSAKKALAKKSKPASPKKIIRKKK
jgi:hypothetical protein